jgi:hypothetical protein
MQLLIKRGQRRAMGGKHVFDLWVQYELTLEEQGLIHKYGLENFVLTLGNVKRDIVKSVLYAWVLSLLVLLFASSFTTQAWELSLLVLVGGSVGIYNQIRETIKVKDIIHGRSFACGSVVALIEREKTILLKWPPYSIASSMQHRPGAARKSSKSSQIMKPPSG